METNIETIARIRAAARDLEVSQPPLTAVRAGAERVRVRRRWTAVGAGLAASLALGGAPLLLAGDDRGAKPEYVSPPSSSDEATPSAQLLTACRERPRMGGSLTRAEGPLPGAESSDTSASRDPETVARAFVGAQSAPEAKGVIVPGLRAEDATVTTVLTEDAAEVALVRESGELVALLSILKVDSGWVLDGIALC